MSVCASFFLAHNVKDLGAPWIVAQLAASQLGWVVLNLPDPATTPASRTQRLVQIAAQRPSRDGATRKEKADLGIDHSGSQCR